MNRSTQASFRCRALTVSVAGRTLVQKLDFDLTGGTLLAILGKNGVGKTLTLHTLAGIRGAETGDIMIGKQLLHEMPRQQLARRLALLPQDNEDIFPATVMDTAMIGRHPHIGRFQWESPGDIEIAKDNMQLMDLDGMADRDIATLSGGERRRLAITQVLTQTPDIFLLDEPSNHLDPQHQLDALQVFRDKARDGAIVITTLHDVNLAARFADECLLLHGDGRWQLGSTKSVLNEDNLSDLYSTPIEAVPWRDHALFVACRQPQ